MATPITVRRFTADELAQRTATEAELSLTGIEILEADPELESTDPEGYWLAETVSSAMLYAAAARRYRNHVDNCTACQESPVWDIECPIGNLLAGTAADACAAQSGLAVWN